MLSKKESKVFLNLLYKIRPKNSLLPQEIFNALNKILPFVACELVIVDKKKGLLLTWRKDKFWKGWHFPGSILRNKEEFAQALKRTAETELGVKLKSFKFLFPMNYVKGARGHSPSFVFLCKIAGIPKAGKFFKTMPKNIILEHRKLWENLK